MRLTYLRELWHRMRRGQQLYFMDQTTTNLWESRPRLWEPKDSKYVQRIASSRGKSRTLMGVLNREMGVYARVYLKTNIDTCLDFLSHLHPAVANLDGACLVLDNHPSHTTDEFL